MLYSPVNNLGTNPYEGVYQYYTDWYWWLRTPGHPGRSDRDTLCVNRSGEVSTYDMKSEFIGIRPAMWIKLDGSSFKKYQLLKFNEQPKYFTMEDMVKAIAVDIIYDYTGDWVYNFGYAANGPGVNKAQNEVGLTGMMPPGYAEWFNVFRMRCWGVLSFDNFDPFAKATYGQFKNYLMKTIEWNYKYGADGNKNFKFTKEILAIAEKKAGIKNTKDSATPVREEIKHLSREVIYWLKAANTLNGKGVRLLESPTKTSYKVGDKFDITGLLVVTGAYGKESNVNSKLTFTAAGVKITPGYKFQTAGTKSIVVSYNGQKLLTYPVTVKK